MFSKGREALESDRKGEEAKSSKRDRENMLPPPLTHHTFTRALLFAKAVGPAPFPKKEQARQSPRPYAYIG